MIDEGSGWTNKDRNSCYDSLAEKELVDAARQLVAGRPRARRDGAGSPPGDADLHLLPMLDRRRLAARYGACQALAKLKRDAAPAVPILRKNLQHEDLWLRVKAAEALAAIGEPASRPFLSY